MDFVTLIFGGETLSGLNIFQQDIIDGLTGVLEIEFDNAQITVAIDDTTDSDHLACSMDEEAVLNTVDSYIGDLCN